MSRYSVGVRLIAAAIAFLMLASMSACSFPISMCSLPDPAEAVEGFFTAYRAGDGELLGDYTCNYDSVSLDGLGDSEYHEKLFALLRENLSFEVTGEAVIDGKNATLPVSVTCFDFRKLSEVLSASTTAAALEYSKQSQSLEDESAVMELLCTVIDELTAEPSVYCTTEPLTITLRYDSRWRVCIDDALCSVLIGHIA